MTNNDTVYRIFSFDNTRASSIPIHFTSHEIIS